MTKPLPIRTLILADDLTGALDVAGPFAQRGVDTMVVVDAQSDWPTLARDAQVVSVNADSRHLSAAAAHSRVTALLERADLRGPTLLFKKIDSTLRGQVVAETLAMMRVANRRICVVAPAFPAQGRTVRDGVVYVNDVPLEDTPFARDALSPPPLAPLHQVFARADGALAAHCVQPRNVADVLQSRTEASQVLVADAVADADLHATVDATAQARDDILWVGSAGVAQALAARVYARLASDPPVGNRAPRTTGAVLVVVGSRSQASHAQVEQLARLAGARVLEAPNGVVDAAQLNMRAGEIVVLRAVPGPNGEGDAAQVAAALGRATAQALRTQPIDAIIATGGDTARAILSEVRCEVLQVMGDLMPGIPYSRIGGTAQGPWLITKAGGFGTPGTFVDIVGLLRKP